MKVRSLLAVVGFVALIAVAGRVAFELPGTGVPQTAQTIAVLLAGCVLGAAAANLCLVLYLLAGAAGLPVFAGGGSGVSTLFGPTGGYLLGFWLAACLLGYWRDRGWLSAGAYQPFLAALAGHALIVLLGGLMLSVSVGLAAAWFNGIQPFVAGALAKSLIAGALMVVYFLIRRALPVREVTHVSQE